MKKFLGLRGQALNLAVGTIAGCDFLLFGYGKFPIVCAGGAPPIECIHLHAVLRIKQIRVSWAVS